MACKINEKIVSGFRAFVLSNDEVSFTILPEKGADIISLRDEKTDTEFLWTSPNGLRHETPSKNFFDNYEGGWHEYFPSSGPAINYRGAEMGQNGEVHALVWNVIEACADENETTITLEVKTIKTPFTLRKKMTIRNRVNVLEIEEWITNDSIEDLPILWGHHPTLGGNFLDANCKIDTLATRVFSSAVVKKNPTQRFGENLQGAWPHMVNIQGETVDVSVVSSPDARTVDTLFLDGFQEGWFAVTNRERKVGIAFLFDQKLFPTVWMWQMYGGGTGFPWYGRAYTLMLGLFTGMPDPQAENIDAIAGTRCVLNGETIHTRLRVLLYRGIKGVGRISSDGVIVPRI